jgi:hypothetical protein
MFWLLCARVSTSAGTCCHKLLSTLNLLNNIHTHFLQLSYNYCVIITLDASTDATFNEYTTGRFVDLSKMVKILQVIYELMKASRLMA